MAFSREHGLPRGGARSVFAPVRSYLHGVELMAGNLEGTLGRGGPSKCGGGSGGTCFAFQAPSSYARGFRGAGFDLLNLANNHSNDFGSSGLRQTLSALRSAHLRHSGLRGEVAVLRARGLRVAYVGFAPYPWASSLLDIGAARRLVHRAARRADVVVAMLHAGAEGAGATHVPHGGETAFGENRGETRRFAHAVVTAGADLVVGSGPHVLRGIECYRRRVIAYSLGNFVGYRTLATGGVLSLSGVLRAELDRAGRLVGGRLLPVRLVRPGVPRPGGSSISQVRRLSRADFGRRACAISHRGAIRMP
jgi:poly-gamma-glutamate capsule biosynthesis protein CapA/YwtB (metallophosphatase superfamily)